jgi:hypothetical protein
VLAWSASTLGSRYWDDRLLTAMAKRRKIGCMALLDPDIQSHMDEAERKAWDALSRYKFVMFGYWAAIWVHWNRAGHMRAKNPFAYLVDHAKGRKLITIEDDSAPARGNSRAAQNDAIPG